MKKTYLFILFLILFFGGVCINSASAYLIEDLNLATTGNMIIGPGKTELLLSPGDSYTIEVTATNTTGETKIVKFTTEDLAASNDPNTLLEFLGDKKGPYSLKDYVKPEADTVTLEAGQRVRMPVTINIPENAAPGGLYGSIMVAAENLPTETTVESGKVAGQVSLITRVAVLLFVRIEGDVLESSYLKTFTSDKNFYEKGPVTFNITSANTGNVYLSPHGLIEIKDMLGRTVDSREIEAWFTLPKSERTREILWNSNFLLGRYTAVLSLYRGYMNESDMADTMTMSFWVLPWKIISIALIALILVIWLLVWILSHIQWKKQPQNPVAQAQQMPPPQTPSDNPPSNVQK
jgi:hypothetical protein